MGPLCQGGLAAPRGFPAVIHFKSAIIVNIGVQLDFGDVLRSWRPRPKQVGGILLLFHPPSSLVPPPPPAPPPTFWQVSAVVWGLQHLMNG